MSAISKNFLATQTVLDIAIKEQENENDSIFLVCGVEGSGKSSFNFKAIDYIEKVKNIHIGIEFITRNLSEFVKMLRNCKDKSVITLDEGSELSSDLHYEGIVKAVKRIFTIVRYKALIVFICFTNPLKINAYFKEDRVKGMFLIIKRKYIFYYTRSRFLDIMKDIKQRYKEIKSISLITQYEPTFKDTFDKYNGHLWKEYLDRKKENAENILDELYEEFGVEDKTFSLRQASKYLGIGIPHLEKFIIYDPDNKKPEQVIPIEWNLTKTKMKIRQENLKEFKAWYENHIKINTQDNTHTINKRPKILDS